MIAGDDDPRYGDGRRQVAREKRVLRRFFLAAYAAGLPIPGSYDELYEYLVAQDAELFGRASTSLWQLAALAQHHGLPTWLLDWTYSWRMAAYFAAKNACEVESKKAEGNDAEVNDADCEGDDDGKLVLWALNGKKLDEHNRRNDSQPVGRQFDAFGIVTVPRDLNPNLIAQDGVFTVFAPRKGEEQLAEKGFQAIAKEIVGNWSEDDALRFTLPRCEAKELYRLVVSEGVSAAKAYPSYDGIATAVKEEAKWLPQDARLVD